MNLHLKYSEDLESPPILVLNQGLENLEVVKKFRHEFKEINPTERGKVIYESKDILGLNHGHMRKITRNLTVDNLKRC